MKKISMEDFTSMLKSDKELAKRLKNYLGQEKDQKIVQKKIMDFIKQEGYEVEVKKEELSMDDLESVSGGVSRKQVGKALDRFNSGVQQVNEFFEVVEGILSFL